MNLKVATWKRNAYRVPQQQQKTEKRIGGRNENNGILQKYTRKGTDIKKNTNKIYEAVDTRYTLIMLQRCFFP